MTGQTMDMDFPERASRILTLLGALIQINEKTGLSFEEILKPVLSRERRGKENPKDADGWAVPHEGTFARRVYDLAKQGKSGAEIVAALSPDHPHRALSAFYRLRNPDAFNARKRINHMLRRHSR